MNTFPDSIKITQNVYMFKDRIIFRDAYAAGWHGSMLDKSNNVRSQSFFPFKPTLIPRTRRAVTNSLIKASSFFSAISAFLLFLSSSFYYLKK
jgi:hypothetical protein